MTNFRALCAELVKQLEGWQCYASEDGPNAKVLDRARAALSQPELPSLKEPTDDELLQVFDIVCLSEGGTVDEIHLRGLRAVLARWGK